jgi:hypothetical protein
MTMALKMVHAQSGSVKYDIVHAGGIEAVRHASVGVSRGCRVQGAECVVVASGPMKSCQGQ